MRTAAELTLGREPDAVPKARRFVRSSLVGEGPATTHAAELVVTELVTNSLLHGEPPVSVRLIHLGHSIRVEVEDTGSDLPVVAVRGPDSMTGRGLAVVAGLSSDWGVEPGRVQGKVVWADLPAGAGSSTNDGSGSGDDRVGRDRSDASDGRVGRVGTDGRHGRDGIATGPDGTLPSTVIPAGRSGPKPPAIAPEVALASRAVRHDEPTCTVQLAGVPTNLLLAAKGHIDDVVRELILLRGGERSKGSTLPPAMARLVETVTEEFAEARAEIKRQALAAAARGDEVTDLELHLPPSYADAGEHYLAALDEADSYARSMRLLTMAPPMSHRVFRRWYVGSLVGQLRALGAGREPEPTEPLSTVLAAQLDQMEEDLRRATGGEGRL